MPAGLMPAMEADTGPALSPRECELLLLFGQGLSNKEVAVALGISPETVKTFTGRIFRKLKVRRRAQAVSYALCNGLIAPAAPCGAPPGDGRG